MLAAVSLIQLTPISLQEPGQISTNIGSIGIIPAQFWHISMGQPTHNNGPQGSLSVSHLVKAAYSLEPCGIPCGTMQYGTHGKELKLPKLISPLKFNRWS